jgi:flagellar assembly protein FliH
MPMIRQADRQEIARDAVVMHLGDLLRQGDSIKEQAVSAAKGIVERAQEERRRLVKNATEEGFKAGFAKGVEAGMVEGRTAGQAKALAETREKLVALDAAWAKELANFIAVRDGMFAAAQNDVARLAIAIAERVVKRTIEEDPAVVTRQVKAVLDALARPTRLVLLVNPLDEEIIRAALPELVRSCTAQVQAEIQSEEAVTRGSCIARMARDAGGLGGEIDASIEVQLDRIAEAIMPGRQGRES